MKKAYPLLLLALWLVAVCHLFVVERINRNNEEYDFTNKTIVVDPDCRKDYSDATIKAAKTFEEVLRSEVNVSMRELQDFSEKEHRKIVEAYQFIENDETERLRRILKKMLPFTYARFQYEIYLVEAYDINAFTIAGGKIYFTTAMMEFIGSDDDELATIIGHEIGHNENSHTIKYLKKLKFWRDYLEGAEIWDVNLSELITDREELITISFGQQDEKSADLCGVYLTHKAGFDPEKGRKIFSRFSQLEGNTPRKRFDKFFRSHPYSVDRKECVSHYLETAKEHAEIARSRNVFKMDNMICERPGLYKIMGIIGLIASLLILFAIIFGSARSTFLSLMPLAVYAFSIWYLSDLPCIDFPSPSFMKETYVNSGDNAVVMVEKRATVKTKAGRLRIRKSPSLNGAILDGMPKNSTLECLYCCCDDVVDGREGKWCYVDYDGQKGYAWGWYILLDE